MVVLTLSDGEAEYLDDILEWWLSGHEDATKQVEEDPTFKDADEYLKALAGMHEQYALGVRIRSQIGRRARGERRTA